MALHPILPTPRFRWALLWASLFAAVVVFPGFAPGQTLVTTTIEYSGPSLLGYHGLAIARDGSFYTTVNLVNMVFKRSLTGPGITFLAGSSSDSGFIDGVGPIARFNDPEGLAVDATGNVYVADRGNQLVRKISPDGAVTTLAGSPGIAGYADGAHDKAMFNRPVAVAVDPEGNVYVADSKNQAIRKIGTDGTVSTFATTCNGGDANGVAIGPAGEIFVSESGAANAIDRIERGGSISTFAGQIHAGTLDGVAGAAQFDSPAGLAVDSQGNVYVADSGNGTIREITPSAQVMTVAGEGHHVGFSHNGVGPAAVFSGPFSLAMFGGVVLVADAGGIRRCVPLSATQSATRLVNVSARGAVLPGVPLTAGFIVQGQADETVLLRAVGPSLAPFDVVGALADPQLDLFDAAGRKLGTGTADWISPGDQDTSIYVGAFPIDPYAGNEAFVATLPPGAYTVQVTSRSGRNGVVLIEAFEVP